MTAIQVLPVVGQSSDFDEDHIHSETMESNNQLTSQSRSFSLSPVSADISEPETETEEDQESRPYLRSQNNKHKENKRPRPHSTPQANNPSSPPSYVHLISEYKQKNRSISNPHNFLLVSGATRFYT